MDSPLPARSSSAHFEIHHDPPQAIKSHCPASYGGQALSTSNALVTLDSNSSRRNSTLVVDSLSKSNNIVNPIVAQRKFSEANEKKKKLLEDCEINESFTRANQIRRVMDRKFDLRVRIPYLADNNDCRDKEKSKHNLYYGVNVLPRSPQNIANDTYTLIGRPIAGHSKRYGDSKEGEDVSPRQGISNSSFEVCSLVEDQSTQEQLSCGNERLFETQPVTMSTARIEDSLEALDRFQDQLESFTEMANFEQLASLQTSLMSLMSSPDTISSSTRGHDMMQSLGSILAERKPQKPQPQQPLLRRKNAPSTMNSTGSRIPSLSTGASRPMVAKKEQSVDSAKNISSNKRASLQLQPQPTTNMMGNLGPSKKRLSLQHNSTTYNTNITNITNNNASSSNGSSSSRRRSSRRSIAAGRRSPQPTTIESSCVSSSTQQLTPQGRHLVRRVSLARINSLAEPKNRSSPSAAGESSATRPSPQGRTLRLARSMYCLGGGGASSLSARSRPLEQVEMTTNDGSGNSGKTRVRSMLVGGGGGGCSNISGANVNAMGSDDGRPGALAETASNSSNRNCSRGGNSRAVHQRHSLPLPLPLPSFQITPSVHTVEEPRLSHAGTSRTSYSNNSKNSNLDPRRCSNGETLSLSPSSLDHHSQSQHSQQQQQQQHQQRTGHCRQQASGRERITRDSRFAVDKERELREREQVAKMARQEASERSRRAGREWAQKQRALRGLDAAAGGVGGLPLKRLVFS